MTPDLIYSRDGKQKGVATGGEHSCRMESCNGNRITTRWEDGNITYPCSKGLTSFRRHRRIM